jgi:aryl-alcohol dehydrogenase-like predicted oxidoreductase
MERTWRIIDAVTETAEARGVTASQVALAWVAQRPAVTSVILGARTTEQLADNLGAASLELSAAEMDRLNEVSDPQLADYPYGVPGQEQRNRSITGGR